MTLEKEETTIGIVKKRFKIYKLEDIVVKREVRSQEKNIMEKS